MFIDEKPDIMCCNFRLKTPALVSEDFWFSLEKQHLKTSKLADNN